MSQIWITIAPRPGRPDRWSATLDETGEVLTASTRTPFLTAARALLGRGADAGALLLARHRGEASWALRAPLSAAAALTVEDPPAGRMRFAPWTPFPATGRGVQGEEGAEGAGLA